MKKLPFVKHFLVFCGLLFPFLSSNVWSGCAENEVKLQILGSGGPELDDQRASSSYLIWADKKAVALIDMGSGSSLNFERSGARIEDLEAVAFTHFHVDHSADFPALVKAAYFSKRQRPLPIYGPAGNEMMPSTTEFLHTLFGPKGSYRYLQDYLLGQSSTSFWLDGHTVKLNKNNVQSFPITDKLNISTIQVHHGPLPALAWRVNINGCSVTLSGDLSNHFHSLEKLAKYSDILVAHNAVPESAAGIARNLHMPPSEIGKIAAKAEITKLVLSHRMQRTLGTEPATLAEIRKNYKGPVLFAEDLDLIAP